MIDASEPWWLNWIMPVVAGTTAIGAALIWIGRVMLLPGIKQELEGLLHEKFLDVRTEIDNRHADNRKDLERLSRQLEESMADRKKLHQQLVEVIADLSYLRGRTSGTFKKPGEL